MPNKTTYYPYYCNKCAFSVYYKSKEEIKENCKLCGNKMEQWKVRVIDEDAALKNTKKKCLSNDTPMNSTAVDVKPTVECPYCHSTNTKKISGTGRWLSTGIFGLASGKIGKQWHCNSCKSDF